MKYSFKQLLKMLFTGKTNPYDNPPHKTYQLKELVPLQELWVCLPEGKQVDINGKLLSSLWINMARQGYSLHEVGGNLFNRDPIQLDPRVSTWTSPMQELFQLYRRDYKNINIRRDGNVTLITHSKLGLSVELTIHMGSRICIVVHNTGLSTLELSRVITACELYVAATKEYQRYLRIKSLSDIRARKQLNALKEQEKINFRNAQTNRIREYLEGV